MSGQPPPDTHEESYRAKRDSITELAHLSEEKRFEMRIVSSVPPFRVNPCVIEELIDLLARLAAAGWLRSLPGPMRSR
jgi:hypothetical protein